MQNENKKENTNVIVSFIIVAVFIGAIVVILMNKTPKENPLEGIKTGEMVDQKASEAQAQPQNPTGDQAIVPNEITNPIQKNMNEVNTNGQVSKVGDTLVMNYTGKFVNGKTFDSNVDPAFKHVSPFEFKLGAGQVIKGWDEGLVGMKVGEKKTLTITPDKAYGPNDYNGIPGNSTLIFDVELVGIK